MNIVFKCFFSKVFIIQKINKYQMKHNSKKRRFKKKRDKMKTPFTITIIVLVLFVVLVVFSIFKGPVEKQGNFDENELSGEEQLNEDLTKDITETGENPSVRTNKAIAAGDISKCENDENCEFSFILNKAMSSGNTEDCNEIQDVKIRNNCKDNVIISKVIETNDKSLCNQIQDLGTKTTCEGI